jgi:hypothetical protein
MKTENELLALPPEVDEVKSVSRRRFFQLSGGLAGAGLGCISNCRGFKQRL